MGAHGGGRDKMQSEIGTQITPIMGFDCVVIGVTHSCGASIEVVVGVEAWPVADDARVVRCTKVAYLMARRARESRVNLEVMDKGVGRQWLA
ncbi:unnamed protein product [Sphenostylis stenocarpa]|uniref:Uncharacterized protein n=1 Tax=Sphenostylis stenocarpa TaxID=92480 RepID=A0AA86W099_9FABA|nr:unnamed protein product [Sphenostylis stenocarpa]